MVKNPWSTKESASLPNQNLIDWSFGHEPSPKNLSKSFVNFDNILFTRNNYTHKHTHTRTWVHNQPRPCWQCSLQKSTELYCIFCSLMPSLNVHPDSLGDWHYTNHLLTYLIRSSKYMVFTDRHCSFSTFPIISHQFTSFPFHCLSSLSMNFQLSVMHYISICRIWLDLHP